MSSPFLALAASPTSARAGAMAFVHALIGAHRPARRTLMCAASPAAAGGVATRWNEVADMRRRLHLAVSAERYGEAATLRDAIETQLGDDPWVQAERQMHAAVEEQRFLDAAMWRDKLSNLAPPPSHSVSGAVTVCVTSYYMREQSAPADGQLLFGYKVRIANHGDTACQLLHRCWVTSSPQGVAEREVHGKGVCGKQPSLQPGGTFEYTSACPIVVKGAVPGIVGSMAGSYTFQSELGEFQVPIQPFYFVLPESAF